MKKLAFFTIFVLIFGTVTTLQGNAYAQNDPNILLRIAQQADKQIQNQLDRVYGNSVPEKIQDLYDEGHIAVESLEQSLPNNIEQAKEDFLTAMKLFQQISRMISESVAESRTTQSDVSNRDLKSELNRLDKYFQNLKTVSQKYDTGINFSEIEQLFEQAYQQINSNEFSAAAETIKQLDSLIDNIKKKIKEYAYDSATERAKKFLLMQSSKIKSILEELDSDTPRLDEANNLVKNLENSIHDDKISDAKIIFAKLIKLVKMIEKSKQ